MGGVYSIRTLILIWVVSHILTIYLRHRLYRVVQMMAPLNKMNY